MKGIILAADSTALESAEVTLRRCARCRQYKPIAENFYQNPNTLIIRCYCNKCHAERFKEYRKSNPEATHQVQVRRWKKVKSDPELHAVVAELRRINRRLNKVMTNSHPVSLSTKAKRIYLDKTPLVREIEAKIRAIGTLQAVATKYGLSNRVLWRVMYENDNITFWLADEICTAFGESLYSLYPECLI